MTAKNVLRESDLDQFTGSDVRYRHALVQSVLLTEGVHYIAETGGAYWLIDAITWHQRDSRVQRADFQAWTLRVARDRSATLTCVDDDGEVVIVQAIDATDFPLPEITFYFAKSVIHLPSESRLWPAPFIEDGDPA